tara:strand:- start:157 stop:591 length:435 start_codon:yes stop_codon:yes gene_type:complete
MPERRMSEVMGEAYSLNQIRINRVFRRKVVSRSEQPSANRATYLGNLKRVSQPCSIEIIFPTPENLSLILQAPKSSGMKYSVTIDLERAPEIALWRESTRQSLEIEFLIEAVSHDQYVPSMDTYGNHELFKFYPPGICHSLPYT